MVPPPTPPPTQAQKWFGSTLGGGGSVGGAVGGNGSGGGPPGGGGSSSVPSPAGCVRDHVASICNAQLPSARAVPAAGCLASHPSALDSVPATVSGPFRVA